MIRYQLKIREVSCRIILTTKEVTLVVSVPIGAVVVETEGHKIEETCGSPLTIAGPVKRINNLEKVIVDLI